MGISINQQYFTKEIHFYKDEYFDKFAYEVLKTTHNETMNCISIDCEVIHTTALSALDFGWLLDKKYKIFLHENEKTLEVKLGYMEEVNRNIMVGHNIAKMWIAGAFESYFFS